MDENAKPIANPYNRRLSTRRRTPSASPSRVFPLPLHSSPSPPPPEHIPLITYTSNKWQDSLPSPRSPSEPEHSSLSPPTSLSPPFLILRNLRRIFLTLLLTLSLLYFITHHLFTHLLSEHESVQSFLSPMNGTYGRAHGGEDSHLWRTSTLPSSLLPGGPSDPKGHRRLIFVGDIHGCVSELRSLLSHVSFNPVSDHLIATGDVISKGPDSPDVLDLLISLGASSVRGNHEDRILTAARTVLGAEVEQGLDSVESSKARKDAELLRRLKEAHFKYLRSMPLILQIPALPLAGRGKGKGKEIEDEMLVVHAGLVPGVALSRQDPYFVMNMRSIHRRTHVPSVMRSSKQDKAIRPWIELWGWYSDRVVRGKEVGETVGEEEEDGGETEERSVRDGSWSGWLRGLFGNQRSGEKMLKPQVVVYGHDSKAGLQIWRWTKGLDTGCVGGGRLTALVLDAWGREEIVGVKCENHKKS